MSRRGQARAVGKMRVVHAKLLGALVHTLNKRLLAAGQVLGQRDRRIVSGNDAHGLDQVAHRHLLALLEPDLTASHGSGVRRARHDIVVGERPGIDGLHRQQQRHNFCHARRLARRVFVLRKQHRTGLFLHQQCARAAHRRRGGGVDAQHAEQQQRECDSFHATSLRSSNTVLTYEGSDPRMRFIFCPAQISPCIAQGNLL